MSGTTWYARLAACLCFALIAACGAHHIEILGPPMAPRG